MLSQPIFFPKFWISTCFFNGKLLLLFSTFNNVKTIIYLKWNIHMCLFELCCRNQFFYFFSKHAFNLSLFCISSFANFPLQCKCRFWLNSAWVPSSQLQCNAVQWWEKFLVQNQSLWKNELWIVKKYCLHLQISPIYLEVMQVFCHTKGRFSDFV